MWYLFLGWRNMFLSIRLAFCSSVGRLLTSSSELFRLFIFLLGILVYTVTVQTFCKQLAN